MRYQSSLPENNVNVSHNHPLREFLLLISGVAGFILLAYWSLGFLVDFAVDHISPEREAQLFSRAKFIWEMDDASSPEKQAVLQGIVDSLSECVGISYPLKVSLVKSEDANALAFPGGNIVVFSGLLEKVKSKNGLTFVLAHELGHFKNRDHLRLLGRGMVLATLSVLLTGANSDFSQMLAPTSALGQAKYSQSRESKADETALHALNCHFGHIGGSTEFFQAMKEGEKKFVFGISSHFSTHPDSQKRIDKLNSLAKDMGFEIKATKDFN